jgi:alpha,alpha-trehalase
MSLFYIENLKQLFVDVQLSRILSDQKIFADSIPKREIAEILNDYEILKTETKFNLKQFVADNFILPNHQDKSQNELNIDVYIEKQWRNLTRKAGQGLGSLIALPNSYVVPGGRFTELFYWDSYFTMLGLQEAENWDLIGFMIDNFAYLINTFGFIPNGNRTYFLSRSQPPFFSLMIELLSAKKGNSAYIDYLPQLQAEYNFWMLGSDLLDSNNQTQNHVSLIENDNILNRYWDKLNTPRTESFYEDSTAKKQSSNSLFFTHIRAACESGWDFSTRWIDKTKGSAITANILPIDLNCLLWHLENTLFKAYNLNGDYISADKYSTLANKRSKNIQQYFWNNNQGIFFDFNLVISKQTEIPTLAMAYPLFFNLCSHKQAQSVANYLENHFLKPGGLLTTLNYSGEQWDAPNGWAPLQWIAFVGLKNYGLNKLANQLKENWMINIETHFRATGKIYEKYNVEDINILAQGGEYSVQNGFGWTNGVYLKMKNYKNL